MNDRASFDVRLYELTKDEWFVVCRRVRPELTEEEFSRLWEDFQTKKAEGRLGPVH